MIAVEVVLGAVLLAVLCLIAVAVRRQALQRPGGTIELSLRLPDSGVGRGWANGVGRFADGGTLRWYRIFSLSPRPRRILLRRELEVVRRRDPIGSEQRALQRGTVVLECRASGRPIELALDAGAVTGFLAWLESRPPGATLPR